MYRLGSFGSLSLGTTRNSIVTHCNHYGLYATVWDSSQDLVTILMFVTSVSE